MKLTMQPTDQIVTVSRVHGDIRARVWRGKTERGDEVQVLVTRIAVHNDSDQSQFEAELQEMPAPQAELPAFPMRLIL